SAATATRRTNVSRPGRRQRTGSKRPPSGASAELASAGRAVLRRESPVPSMRSCPSIRRGRPRVGTHSRPYVAVDVPGATLGRNAGGARPACGQGRPVDNRPAPRAAGDNGDAPGLRCAGLRWEAGSKGSATQAQTRKSALREDEIGGAGEEGSA